MKRFLLWLFPEIRAELNSLRSANTKVVLENAGLLDRLHLPVDSSIAKQLQASIERNSRMVGRLQKFLSQLTALDEPISQRGRKVAISTIQTIMKDEEPLWPEV